MAEACGCRVEQQICSSLDHPHDEDSIHYQIIHCPRHSETHVAALEQERDEALAAMTGDRADVTLECAVLRRECDNLKKQIAQATEALRTYGKHSYDCDCLLPGTVTPSGRCTCGLSSFLAAGMG